MNLSSKKRTYLILIVLYAITSLVGISFVLNTKESIVYSITDNSTPSKKVIEEEPIMDESTTDVPVTNTPVIDDSIADNSIADVPVTNTPVIDDSIADDSIADVPVTNDTVVDDSIADVPIEDDLAPTVFKFFTNSQVNVRIAADRNSQIIGVAKNGRQGTLLTYGDEWCYIQIDSTIGYIATAYITISE